MSIHKRDEQDGEVAKLPISLIDLIPDFNPRKQRNAEKDAENLESIRQHGVIQAILVRPHAVIDGRFQLVAGEGRYLNSKKLGLVEIPALIRELTDSEALACALAENKAREDMSIADEAVSAVRAVQMVEGDKAEAAKFLGWTPAHLERRLLLRHATDRVLDALRRSEIMVGHAELLATLPAETQDGTLDKVIQDKVSVAALKERLQGFAQPLAKAAFDTTGCNGCPHNSSVQNSLFSESIGVGKCSNRACWSQKTKAFLEAKKADLIETYPVIFMATEKPATTRVALVAHGSKGVGAEQAAACKGCAHYGAVLDDAPGREGQVTEGQCFNLPCNRKMVAAHLAAEQAKQQPTLPSQAVQATAIQGGAGKPGSADTQPAGKPGADPAKISGVVVEHNRKYLQETAAYLASIDPSIQQAIVIRALSHLGAGIEVGDRELRGDDIIRWALGQDDATRRATIHSQIARYLVLSKASHNGYHAYEDTKAILCYPQQAERNMAAVGSRWAPTKEILDAYQKVPLEALLVGAGFAKAYDAGNGERAFEKLMKGKKTDAIAAILAFPFDWSAFVPPSVLKELDSTIVATGQATEQDSEDLENAA